MIQLTRKDTGKVIFMKKDDVVLVEDNSDCTGSFVYLRTKDSLREVTESPCEVNKKIRTGK